MHGNLNDDEKVLLIKDGKKKKKERKKEKRGNFDNDEIQKKYDSKRKKV